MQRKRTRGAGVVAAICFWWAAPATADYSFEIDGNGTEIKIWWTDSRGNRIGDPLYEGTLLTGETVRRSTTSAEVFDHSLKEIKNASVGFSDLHWGNVALAELSIEESVSLPTLVDLDPAGGLVHVFFIIDGRQYVLGGGHYQPGRIYEGFNPDGTHPELPGYIVGWSNNPEMTIEEAFHIDFETGVVLFQGAQPFHAGMGPLMTNSRLTVLPTTCAADFDGDGFVTGIDYDLYVLAFEAGCG